MTTYKTTLSPHGPNSDEQTDPRLTALVERARRWHRFGLVGGERPEGCWCEGRGGRTEANLYPVGNFTVTQSLPLWQEYCACPEGQACQADEGGLRLYAERLRRQLHIAHIWKGAGIPPHFADLTLDTYPTDDHSAAVVQRLREWIQTERWLLLWGPYGTGKTGLAVGLFRELMNQGPKGGLFHTVPAVLDRIRETYDRDGQRRGDPTERDLLGTLREVEILVLDDMGAERPSPWVAEKLFGLINHRHDYRKRTIITSNLSPAELGTHVGERTVWRVIEMAEVINLDGANLRDRRTEQTRVA